MRSHLPFAFPIDLQAGAVHHNIQMPTGLFGQGDLQTFASPRQGGMVWNRQLHRKHGKDRAYEPFGGTVRQMKHILHCQHDDDCLSTVLKLAAALLFSCIPPVRFKVI
jgi:hypothetical protein